MKQPPHSKPHPKTSWQGVQKWYSESVGEGGHYYHQHLVIPGVLRLLNLKKDSHLLDIACGQGVLGRHIPKESGYTGLDISPSLIKEAERLNKNAAHTFLVADATKKWGLKKKDFTHAAIILAIQNIEFPALAFKNAATHLREKGKLIIVMNHPCYRIPRQSSWKVDENSKIQYRRVDRYMSAMPIPIQANPSKGKESETTWSFHYPLSTYTKWLKEAGFVIHTIEEWCSDKESTGKMAKMENRSREEFPLFLTIEAEVYHPLASA